MLKINKQSFLFYFCRIFSALALAALFVLPLGMMQITLNDPNSISTLLFPYTVAFIKDVNFYAPGLQLLFYSIYFLPLTFVVLVISIFVKKIPQKLLYFLVLISLTIYLFCGISCMIICANTSLWFKSLPLIIYITFGFAIISHLALSILGIINIRLNNPQYAEYKVLRQEEIEKSKNKKNNDKKTSLKTKLTLFIIGTISIILFSFMVLILRRYQNLITETVTEAGRTTAEQTAAIYETAEGKYEKILYFFNQQKKSNEYADTPFERIDIIISSVNAQIFMEEITADTELPPFDVFAYTTGKALEVPAEEKTLSNEQAADYIKRYQTGAYRKTPIYNKANGTCKFVYPVTLPRKKGSKLVGFSIVTYREDVLMKPYFQTKVAVFALSAVFFYLAVILSIFLSDYIANPLLFLRSNVRKTSKSLSVMMSGKGTVTSDTIQFEDTIKTRDEIKDLSTEIGDMVSLIRGMVPYISFSTLKHADAESKRSINRELCFLFTDIRGFTTLCEGRAPKEIVSLLNHYLDIETEIIHKNGGDIDKFVGDEMMAFFAGPRKEYNACKAAMEIRAAMKEQQQLSKEKGKEVIQIGIGINTGNVVFGSVGSKTRMDFTSIGDTVNLAARLEGANKAYGSKSIISEAVYDKLNNTFVCRELDFITVKGKSEPVRIYEILQLKSKSAEKLDEIKTLFEFGLHYYRNKQWDKSEQYFNQCYTKFHDLPSKVFLERIHHFKLVPPPAKWDGVFEMKVK